MGRAIISPQYDHSDLRGRRGNSRQERMVSGSVSHWVMWILCQCVRLLWSSKKLSGLFIMKVRKNSFDNFSITY